MSNQKHVERAWDEYRARVIPKAASGQQVHDMKVTFFAGALVILTKILASTRAAHEAEGTDGEEQATDDGVNMLHDLDEELVAFTLSVIMQKPAEEVKL